LRTPIPLSRRAIVDKIIHGKLLRSKLKVSALKCKEPITGKFLV